MPATTLKVVGVDVTSIGRFTAARGEGEIDSDSVTSAILGALRELANEPGAQEAATSFGSSLSISFLTWIVGKVLKNVLGKGMVPSFAPPYVPVGPVVNGDVLPTPGIIN